MVYDIIINILFRFLFMTFFSKKVSKNPKEIASTNQADECLSPWFTSSKQPEIKHKTEYNKFFTYKN